MVKTTNYKENGVDIGNKYIDYFDRRVISPEYLDTLAAFDFTEGALLVWGWNGIGQLGKGDSIQRSAPDRINNAWTNIADIDAGYYHHAAIVGRGSGPPNSGTGSLWTWGYNGNGALGDGTIIHRSSPVQVGTLTTWTKVSAGGYETMAVKNDGTIWIWGANSVGQLGQNVQPLTQRSSPVQIGSLTNWKIPVLGNGTAGAIKTDGTMWMWGGSNGKVGDGTQTHRSSPVQIGTLTTWTQLTIGQVHNHALKSDGTLWSWGNNAWGQLATGNLTDRSSPVQVGTLTDWRQVSAGEYAAAAVKIDGTLWTWGTNFHGELGDSTTVPKSSPVQIGTLTDWSRVEANATDYDFNFCMAVKTNGTLWSWGRNDNGQLGLGDNTTKRSSPTQVGPYHGTWKKVSVGGDSVIGLAF